MTHSTTRILVIVPAYNEVRVIRKTLSELLDHGYEVLLVDDASDDGTYDCVRDLEFHYLRHEINLGQGAALMTGMKFAREKGYDIVVHFDADGQHRVEDISVILAPLLAGLTDVTLGSRFLVSKHGRKIPLGRRLLLKCAVWVNGLFTGIWLSDAHNGLRGLNRKALDAIRLREEKMAHATEILSQIRVNGLQYLEIPIEVRYSEYSRQKGQSFPDAFSIFTDLVIRKLFF